ncbi:MAG: glutamate--tRNA ligase [Owenweeksia sp.]
MSERKVRVRFAPSPTGPLHMGGVRTALYNYLFAKKHGGEFILRIEDTDQTRFVKGAEDYIIESLKWCHILPDEGQGFSGNYGPYRQSERKSLYRKYADQLIESGHAYYAFDTAEELDQMRDMAKQAGTANWQYNHVTRNSMKNSLTLSQQEVNERLERDEPYVIRIKLPRNEEVKFHDIIRGWVSVNTNNMDDKVLFKSDGMPTYHLANIVDDRLMDITHVIRGEEWLPSAPLHILLYRYLGWEEERPEFAHLPLLLKPDGNGKLSKRDGDRLGFPVFPLQWRNSENGEIFSGYREQGYFADAFVNMLAFLGWNPGTDQELFTMQELIDSFTLERVNKAGARYDHDKTRWFNQQYLRAQSDEQLGLLFQEELYENQIEVSHEYATDVARVMKERAYFVKDMLDEGQYFFEAPVVYDAKTVEKKWNAEAREHVANLKQHFETLQFFDAETLEKTFKAYLEERSVGFGKVGPGFRLAITGLGMGPSMFEVCAILGKQETISRMEKALAKLPA